MTTWYKHRIYCTTDSQWEEKITESETLLTSCPSDPGHSVQAGSANIEETLSDTNVHIQEEVTPTGGVYKAFGRSFTATPLTTTTDTFVTEYPMSILAGIFDVSSDQVGDVVNIDVAPNTIIGAITSNVTSGDTVISVDNTVVANMRVGRWLRLFDGSTASDRVLCTGVDSVNNTVTINTGISDSFLTSSTTYVQMTIRMVENYRINTQGRIEIGSSKIGAKHFPVGTAIEFKYTRNKITSVTVGYVNEILY